MCIIVCISSVSLNSLNRFDITNVTERGILYLVSLGIRFGTGDKPNERDLQTAEFRSVIQAREGAVPLNRTTRGGASGSSPGSGSGPNQNASTNVCT